jgi:putative PIN family toxin of toxin-antitoxin system
MRRRPTSRFVIVTLDTGILVRATSRSRGPARELLRRIANNSEHVLALSPFIVAEVGKALAHPRLTALLRITPDEIHEHVAYLRQICRLVEPALGMPIVLTDPADDPVVYTAVGAGARVLCSRDRDFRAPNVIAFCRRYAVEIMDEIQLLAALDA